MAKVTFLGSDIYKWLNEEFKNRAFNDEEIAVMASPVSLMSKEDAMNLPMTYRKASSTDYAISQGADAKRCLWWVGDFSKTYEFIDYYGWWWYDSRRRTVACLLKESRGPVGIRELGISSHWCLLWPLGLLALDSICQN